MKKTVLSPVCSLTLCLTAVLLLAGLAAQIARAFVPNVILPPLDIPTLAALSLIALVAEVVFFGVPHRFWATSLIVGALAFGGLSLCAGAVPTAIEALREPYGPVCRLCLLEERSPQEAALALGRPVKTVHTQLARGKELLRRQLEGRGIHGEL